MRLAELGQSPKSATKFLRAKRKLNQARKTRTGTTSPPSRVPLGHADTFHAVHGGSSPGVAHHHAQDQSGLGSPEAQLEVTSTRTELAKREHTHTQPHMWTWLNSPRIHGHSASSGLLVRSASLVHDIQEARGFQRASIKSRNAVDRGNSNKALHTCLRTGKGTRCLLDSDRHVPGDFGHVASQTISDPSPRGRLVFWERTLTEEPYSLAPPASFPRASE